MNTIQRIAKNTSVMFTSKILSYVIGLFYIIYIARYLGAEGYGVLSFAIAFTAFFVIFADLGLSTLMVREIARDKVFTGKYIINTAVIKLILSILTFGLIIFFLNILDYPIQTNYIVYIIALSGIINSFSQIFYSAFQAHENMQYQSVGLVLNSSLLLLGALIIIKYELNILSVANLYLIASIITLIYIIVISLIKSIFPKFEIDVTFWKIIIIDALPFTFIGAFVVVNQNVDCLMLSKFINMTAVGWYSSAYNLVLALEFIPAALIAAIYPITSKFHNSKEKQDFILERGLKYMLLVGLPIGIITTLLADKIVLLIYGKSFIPSIIALQILVWSEVIIFVNMLFNNLLISTNKQISIVKQFGIVITFNIVINLILIPRFSFVGASIATVASSLLSIIILYYFISKEKYFKKQEIVSLTIPILIACIIMAVYIYIFHGLELFFIIFSSIGLYLIILYLLRVFDEVDFNMVRKILNFMKEE